jgi:membrane-associated phospholipid phosphatase
VRGLIVRAVITAIALTVWFWTQSLIGARPLPAAGIGDALHDLTAPINSYFLDHPRAANALLIGSSAGIDALAVFLLASWLFGRSIRPLLGLLILVGLRQIMQRVCALPPPPNMIWHNPGFPSLLVTYSVAGDFFFSGHTAIAVFGAAQLSRLGRPWLTALAWCLAIFEAMTVIVLRAHYAMDVFAGAVTALWVDALLDKIVPALDRQLARRMA